MAKGLQLVNLFVSVLTGAAFAASWWLIIDGFAYADKFLPANEHLLWWHFVAPLITSLGVLLLNLVSQKAIHGGGDSIWGGGGDGEVAAQRGLLFGFLTFGALGVGAAGWIYALRFQGSSSYGGVTLLAGTLAIYLDGIIFKFARLHKSDDW